MRTLAIKAPPPYPLEITALFLAIGIYLALLWIRFIKKCPDRSARLRLIAILCAASSPMLALAEQAPQNEGLYYLGVPFGLAGVLASVGLLKEGFAHKSTAAIYGSLSAFGFLWNAANVFRAQF